ncbi:MAG: glycosyltransferase family 4 protein [Candidatus Omnitrophota bacterium]
MLAHLLKKKSGAKHIFTCHGFFKIRFFRKLFPCWPDATIAISESVQEHLLRDFKADEKDVFVVHNGIDLEKFKIPALPAGRQNSKFKDDMKKRYGLRQGPVIGIVGRLSDVKGHIYLIQAMPCVLKSFPETQLLIVGDGKMKKELMRMVENLGLKGNVVFVPCVSDTREAFCAMDVFVMPSLKEGLGLALMEAMASGLPVIGSDVGGIRSLIQEGENGLLVKPSNVTGLSQACLRILGDPQKSRSLGEAARAFIHRNFSQDKMVTQTEEVYLKCLNDS